MITATTPTLCVSLPDRFVPNQELTALEAQALESIFRQRLRIFVTYWLDKKGLTPSQAQTNLNGFALTYEFTSRPPNEILDPITLEALRLARDIVIKHLAQQNIDLDDESITRHAAQVAKLETIRSRAEEIVTLRQQTAEESLRKVRP